MKPFGLLTEEELSQSPSVLDGMSPELVNDYTRKSMVFIRNVGDLLQLQLISRSTARVFFHRFFSRQSFKKHDRFIVSATCILLACKVEEDIRKLDAVLDAFFAARKGNQRLQSLPRDNPEVSTVREKVLLCERILLHTVGFDITIEHPHSSALKILRTVKGMKTELKQATWNILNDSLNVNMCLRFPPKLIAVAAVHCASQFLKSRPQPLSKETQSVLERVEKIQETNEFDADQVNLAINTLLDAYDSTTWPPPKPSETVGSERRKEPPTARSEESIPPAAKRQKTESENSGAKESKTGSEEEANTDSTKAENGTNGKGDKKQEEEEVVSSPNSQ